MKCNIKSAVILGTAVSHGLMLLRETFPGAHGGSRRRVGKKDGAELLQPPPGEGELCLW